MIRDEAVDQAVRVAIAAVPMSTSSWIGNPEAVAKFIEAVAKKIEELKSGK